MVEFELYLVAFGHNIRRLKNSKAKKKKEEKERILEQQKESDQEVKYEQGTLDLGI